MLVLTSVLCAVHSVFKPYGLFSSIPMMFGAIASTFFAGADKWLYLMITLCLGVLLGYVVISESFRAGRDSVCGTEAARMPEKRSGGRQQESNLPESV